MNKRYRIRGTVRIEVPFQFLGEVGENDLPLLDKWDELAESHLVEGAIQDALVLGQFDIDPFDIEIDSVKEAKEAGDGN